MFDDRIEIISPGGLPSGITEEEYLAGKLSVLRNRNLAKYFTDWDLLKIFGTGIIESNNYMKMDSVKPDFEVSENSIKVVLPEF